MFGDQMTLLKSPAITAFAGRPDTIGVRARNSADWALPWNGRRTCVPRRTSLRPSIERTISVAVTASPPASRTRSNGYRERMAIPQSGFNSHAA